MIPYETHVLSKVGEGSETMCAELDIRSTYEPASCHVECINLVAAVGAEDARMIRMWTERNVPVIVCVIDDVPDSLYWS